MNTTKPYLELFDDQGVSQGLWISPDLWELVGADVQPILARASGHDNCAAQSTEPEIVEPMADWNTLMEYWDFSYPLESSVTCGHCGAQYRRLASGRSPQIPAQIGHLRRPGELPLRCLQGARGQTPFQGRGQGRDRPLLRIIPLLTACGAQTRALRRPPWTLLPSS